MKIARLTLGLFFLAGSALGVGENPFPSEDPFPFLSSRDLAGIARVSSSTAHDTATSWGTGGTAFVVDSARGLLLTNLHNLAVCANVLGVEGDLQTNVLAGKYCPESNISFIFEMSVSKLVVKGAQILAHGSTSFEDKDAYADWALLQVKSDLTGIPSLKLSKERPPVGALVRIIGYPVNPTVGAAIVDTSSARQIVGQHLSLAQSLVVWSSLYSKIGLAPQQLQQLSRVAEQEFYSSDEQFFLHAPLSSGLSGSPVFNSRNEVVAIIWGSTAVWMYDFGDMPEALGVDGTNLLKPANRLGASFSLHWLGDFLRKL